MFGMGFLIWPMDHHRKQTGASMNSQLEGNELEEVYIQGVEIKVPAHRSLPAGQVIAEHSQDARQHPAPRFIP
jgi:hypothetical protein